MVKRSIAHFISCHTRARKGLREAYWELNDRPEAYAQCIQPQELWTAGGPTFPLFGGSIYTRKRLAEATDNYIAYCRKKRRWSHYHAGAPEYVAGQPFFGPRFNAASLKAFREKVKQYEEQLDRYLAEKSEKDIKSGRTAALSAYSKAQARERTAEIELADFIRTRASAAEIGRYANYLRSAVNNDFAFHHAEWEHRSKQKPAKTPCPSLSTILSLAEDIEIGAMATFASAMKRLARSRK